MSNVPKSIVQKLQKRRQDNSYRKLSVADGMIDFFSNDYLGLAKWTSNKGYSQGSTGSRLISGNAERTERIEQDLATFFVQDSGLLFNSGYDANLGLFSSVPLREDTIIYDQLIHASVRDGIKLGRATAFSFRHNDLHHLKQRLEQAEGNTYVAVEAVYSMDGGFAPLQAISAICNDFGAYLIVDEAHSGGIIGPEGKGLVTALDLDAKIFAKLMTFGKAYGSHGALVLGSEELRNYLINYAHSFLYTTALSPDAQERIFKVVCENSKLKMERLELKENINFFKSEMNDSNFDLMPSDFAIQCGLVPGNDAAKRMAEKIWDKGIGAKAILYPTVPMGTERLRFCLHSFNSKDEIRTLVGAING